MLLFDIAPEWEAGGNSRYSAQIMRTGTDREKLIQYYEALYGERSYDKDIIAAGTKLEAIAKNGIGVDNIDVAEANARGIAVLTPGHANTWSVAEHTMSPWARCTSG